MKIDIEKIIKQSKSNIENIPLKEFSESAYLNYSMYVIPSLSSPTKILNYFKDRPDR